MLLRAVWLLLAAGAALPAWARDEVVLRAGSRPIALPAGATAFPPVVTRWLDMPLQVQGFHAAVAVDVLAHRLAAAMASPPALLVEPGRAMLVWYEAPVHWLIQLTGQGAVTHGRLSGLTLPASAPGRSPAREPGVPAYAKLLQRSPDADDEHGHRVQVYVADGGLPREDMVAGLRRAGWRVSALQEPGSARLRRGDASLQVHCLPRGVSGACVLVHEAAR